MARTKTRRRVARVPGSIFCSASAPAGGRDFILQLEATGARVVSDRFGGLMLATPDGMPSPALCAEFNAFHAAFDALLADPAAI